MSDKRNSCERARAAMAGFVDGEPEAAWVARHTKECEACSAALAAFTAIDGVVQQWGQRLERENPAPGAAREQLAARLQSMPRRRPAVWMPAAVGAIAAALGLVMISPPARTPGAGSSDQPPFIEIPYVAPLDPHENATVVRMRIRVSTLISVGYRVTADPDATVPAEVLVGEDGRAHAVRVLSEIDSKGTGD